ncbi:MAG: hypothetical protein HQK83_04590 [Fibrobacteria bacterium]|nr:hypothetical protein [Fibrobacteria bacterium]
MSKIEKLIEIEGFDDPLEFLSQFVHDSVCPGICSIPGCDYTTDVEPDQEGGWCEHCETNTVKSGIVLAGII